MKLEFLGTRGYIDAKSRRHRRHTATMVIHEDVSLLIDCGLDWEGQLPRLAPDAIAVTHAHPDHAHGLKAGTERPVYAPEVAWRDMAEYPIDDRRVVAPRERIPIGPISLEAFPVVHSLRCPAVGYRIEAGGIAVFYVPDVVDIEQRREALAGVRLYVGDGATITRSLVRRRGDELFGHTTVRAQLGWCQETGVKRAIFTHCGGGDRHRR
ncbi:MAG: MBL fold metallo-hydrolase [Rhodospirillales bacterium]|nr:MAG: MBL fold metallo-hydrolase [Rhodospirillales bacterium]